MRMPQQWAVAKDAQNVDVDLLSDLTEHTLPLVTVDFSLGQHQLTLTSGQSGHPYLPRLNYLFLIASLSIVCTLQVSCHLLLPTCRRSSLITLASCASVCPSVCCAKWPAQASSTFFFFYTSSTGAKAFAKPPPEVLLLSLWLSFWLDWLSPSKRSSSSWHSGRGTLPVDVVCLVVSITV